MRDLASIHKVENDEDMYHIYRKEKKKRKEKEKGTGTRHIRLVKIQNVDSGGICTFLCTFNNCWAS